MERSSLVVLVAVCILAAFIVPGYSLKCYECNSHNDSRCAQEMPPSQLEKDCSTHQNEAHKYTLCRKIVQTIEYEVNGLQPDTRVIRSCGWDDTTYKNACYQRSGFGGRQEVCSCTTDLCNSSPSQYSTSFLVGASSFILVSVLNYLRQI